MWTWLDGPPASECASATLNLGKKRVWVPDEQDAYVEAEVKSEATGGRVNVETKDQKVWLPLSPVLAPPPPAPLLPPRPPSMQLLASCLYERGSGRVQG